MIADFRSYLSRATNTLQLDLSIILLPQLSKVGLGAKKLIEGSELFSTQVLDSVSEVDRNRKQETSRALESEEQDVMNRVGTLEFCFKHNDALSRRQKGTSRWLLGCSEFRS